MLIGNMLNVKEKIKEKKNRNRLRFFQNSIYNSFLIVFILFFLFIIINSLMHNGDLNQSFIFNKRPTIIITGSMEPVVKVNSIVVLEPVLYDDIEIGDIIRYNSNMGYSILHRVIEKTDSYLITKGDANSVPDSLPVLPEQVTGRVTEIHNEFADILTLLFGQFEYENVTGSILRFCLGFIFIGIIISICITAFIVIFEMITTTYTFKKYNVSFIQEMNYWQDNNFDIDRQCEIVQNYLYQYKNANILKKIILSFKFRQYYNGLCNIEREVNKTNRRLRKLSCLYSNMDTKS